MELSRIESRSVRLYLQPVPGSPLFSGLDRDQVSLLQEVHGPQRRAERDDQLVRARDLHQPLLTISSGWAFRYVLLPDGRRQVLRIAFPGDTVGLDTLLSGGPVYPVQAGRAVVYSEMAHHRAMHLVEHTTWFRHRAIEALARERAEAERAVTRMGQCKAEEAIASVLLDFYHELTSRGLAAKNQFKLELTQNQLADFVGLTVVHLNRTLGRLRLRGLVSMTGSSEIMLNVPELERLALPK